MQIMRSENIVTALAVVAGAIILEAIGCPWYLMAGAGVATALAYWASGPVVDFIYRLFVLTRP